MSALPEGFSYLSDIDPSIVSSLRYYGAENFIGSNVHGYLADKVILTTKACESLKKAQGLVQLEGYSLVVYDGYRPQKAVNYFQQWSVSDRLSEAQEQKQHSYYPKLERLHLFDLGYIASRSGHSRGSTVDLTLIEVGRTVNPLPSLTTREHMGAVYPYLDDQTLDMGSSFDLFDALSHHDCPEALLPREYSERRGYLRGVMERCSFRCYSQEWWHYTLEDEPFPDTYFDFDIL